MSSAGQFRTSDEVAESNNAHSPKSARETETERVAETLISIEEIMTDEAATTKPKVKRLRKGKQQDDDGKRGGYRKYTHEQLEQAMEALRSGRVSLCDAEKQFSVPKATLFGRMRRSHVEKTSSSSVLSKDEFGALDEVRSVVLSATESGEDVVRIAFRSRTGRDIYDSDSASDSESRQMAGMEKPEDEWIRMELHSALRCETDNRRDREVHASAFATLVHAGFDELVSLVRGRIAIRCVSLEEIETILNAYQRRSPFRFIRSRVDKHAAQFGALPSHSELLAKNAIQFRSRSGAQNVIEFDGVPFVKVAERRFVCEHSRRPESKQLRTGEPSTEPVAECDVHVCIMQLVRFPQYKLLTDTNRSRLFCSSLLLRDFVDQRTNVILECFYLVYLPSIVEHCQVHNYDLTSATFLANDSQLLTVRDDIVAAETDGEPLPAETTADSLSGRTFAEIKADVDAEPATQDVSVPNVIDRKTVLHGVARSAASRRIVPFSSSAAAQASRKRAARLGRPAFDFKFPSLLVTSRPGRKVTRRSSTPANYRVVPCVFELIRFYVLEQGMRDPDTIQIHIRDWWYAHCGVVPVESDWARRPPQSVVQHQIERVLRGCTAPQSDVEETEELPADGEAAEQAMVDVDVDVDAEAMPLGEELKPEATAGAEGEIVFADEAERAPDSAYEYAFEPDAIEQEYAMIEPATLPKARRGRGSGAGAHRNVTPASAKRREAAQQRMSTRRRGHAQTNGIEVDDAVRTISLDQPDVTIVDLDDVAEWVQLA